MLCPYTSLVPCLSLPQPSKPEAPSSMQSSTHQTLFPSQSLFSPGEGPLFFRSLFQASALPLAEQVRPNHFPNEQPHGPLQHPGFPSSQTSCHKLPLPQLISPPLPHLPAGPPVPQGVAELPASFPPQAKIPIPPCTAHPSWPPFCQWKPFTFLNASAPSLDLCPCQESSLAQLFPK